jgi:hypothetical protein
MEGVHGHNLATSSLSGDRTPPSCAPDVKLSSRVSIICACCTSIARARKFAIFWERAAAELSARTCACMAVRSNACAAHNANANGGACACALFAPREASRQTGLPSLSRGALSAHACRMLRWARCGRARHSRGCRVPAIRQKSAAPRHVVGSALGLHFFRSIQPFSDCTYSSRSTVADQQ